MAPVSCDGSAMESDAAPFTRGSARNLGANLPSGHRVHHKITWVRWEKHSADQLLANLRLWMEDVQGTVFALDMLAEVRGYITVQSSL